MLSLLKKYTPPVVNFRFEVYEREGTLLRLKLRIFLEDKSILHVKEYKFSDGSRKYAYHWEDVHGKMRMRWDNAAHYPDVPTFPHHKHRGTDNDVLPSTETHLEAVLQQIAISFR
jgi:hypothetical protein